MTHDKPFISINRVALWMQVHHDTARLYLESLCARRDREELRNPRQ